MNPIENTLSYARLGWRLFPCTWNGSHKPLVRWSEKTYGIEDERAIRVLSKDKPHIYWCVATKASDLVVIDVDIKNGKEGFDTLFDLEIANDFLPDTLEVKTPSGGVHYIYKGACAQGVNRLGKGIDIPVMIPLPGSEIPGKGGYAAFKMDRLDTLVADLPQWVIGIAGEPKQMSMRVNAPPGFPLDSPADLLRAESYLLQAPVSIENDGGNNILYIVAAKCRDFGVSRRECFALMDDHWNARCAPPWVAGDLLEVISHVYQYAQNGIGSKSISSDFEEISRNGTLEGKKDENGEEKTSAFVHIKHLLANWKAPQWLIQGYFEEKTISLIYGESGTYKSFLALDIALSVASGIPWAGKKVKRGAVFYIAGEGHGGIARRIKAWSVSKNKRNLDFDKCPFLVSKNAIHLDNKTSVMEVVKDISALRKDYGPPVLIVIDTLATSFGGGDENSTRDMNTFLNYISAGLRDALGSAVIIVHHSGHGAKNRPRGAYSLMAGVDAHYKVAAGREDRTLVLKKPGKIKDGTPLNDTWFKLESIKVGVSGELESITSLVPVYCPECEEEEKREKEKTVYQGVNQNKIVSILSAKMEGMKEEEVREVFREGKPVFNRGAFIKARESLLSKGVISREGDLLLITNFRSE